MMRKLLAFLGCLIIPIAFYVWAKVEFGSLDLAIAYVRGDLICPIESVVSVGNIEKETIAELHLRNLSNENLYISGGYSECGCMATEGLPKELPKQETVTIPVRIFSGKIQGTFRKRIMLFVQSDTQIPVKFEITGYSPAVKKQ